MKIQTRVVALPFVLIVFLVYLTPLFAQEPVWKIGPRTLPVPATVAASENLRDALLQTPTPDVAVVQAKRLKTDEEWKAFAREMNLQGAEVTKTLAAALGVTVTEEQVAGVNVHWVTPPAIDEQHQSHLFVFVHRGAWVLNAGLSGTTEAVMIASRLKILVISIDYRMPPDHPAPAATEDVAAVWNELLKERSPASMVMGRTSAGGNITLSSIHRFKDVGLPVPASIYVGTPAVDVKMTGDSRFLNEGVDHLLVSWKHFPNDAGELGKNHPYVSPIYGDFSGFPPAYIIAGTRDLMLSDAVRAHRALRRAGVDAELHVYEGHSHGDYLEIWDAPESEEHYAELNRFVLKYLSNPLPAEASLPTDLKDIELPKSLVY